MLRNQEELQRVDIRLIRALKHISTIIETKSEIDDRLMDISPKSVGIEKKNERVENRFAEYQTKCETERHL